MARPPGAGPFSAVVLLHGCGGFHSSMISWADRLSRFGYAALAIDSFGPRGIDEYCGGGFPEQPSDGYAALRYLTTKPFVRASHVAVMGFSRAAGPSWPPWKRAWWSSSTGEIPRRHRLLSDLPVRLGDHDAPGARPDRRRGYWTPSSPCEAMAAGRTELGAPRTPGDRPSIELVIYPGAHHGFDLVDLSLVRTAA